MKFTIENHEESRSLVFHGSVYFSDLADLSLSPLDHALLKDVGEDNHATAADYLLALEMIFRRYAEQQTPA